MPNTVHEKGHRRRSRSVGIAAVFAAVTLVVTACGGGGGDAAAPAPAPAAPDASGGTQDAITDVTAQVDECPTGTPGEGSPSIALGTKNFAEQFVLGQLYKQTLESRGYTVEYRPNIGGSEVIDQAFQAGEIDMYPEYLGEIETSLAGLEVGESPEATFEAAKQFEETQRGATILPQTPFQNTDVLIVKPAFAEEFDLETVPDLANVGPAGEGVTLAAQPPFETRFNGLAGMMEVYGLTAVAFNGVDVGLTYQALDQDIVNVADAFSTDGQLSTGDYVALDDPENIFGFQHVAPVITQAALDAQGPEFAETLNCVSTLLTTDAMQALNAEVQLNGADPAAVAGAFLSANEVLAE